MQNPTLARSAYLRIVFLMLVVVASAAQGQEKLDDYDKLVTEADREHWSFQPVIRPDIPVVEDQHWVLNPIDNFVLGHLENKGWQPSRAVVSRTLLRRAYLDVIGIPPSLDEQEEFLSNPNSNAFAKVVDQLLARPGFGERQARHWLDLVRYAETNGYERDADKPHVWRYRDYVIESFNSDKPYDSFVLEQLAGDELDEATSETVIATGFYRLGPWDDEPADPKQDRFDQLDDIVRTTSQSFLGITLGCARCHNHKFDPFTMHDYYRMVAIFDPLSRPRNGRTELDTPAGSYQQRARLRERDRLNAESRKQINEVRRLARAAFLDSETNQLSKSVLNAFRTSQDKRSPEQKTIVKDNAADFEQAVAAAMSVQCQQQIADLELQVRDRMRAVLDLPRGYFMIETSSNRPQTHLLLRGRAALPGPRVQSGLPAVLVRKQFEYKPDKVTSRRRITLARWIANSQNPLTARVIVNRVWQNHFGLGLVRTPSDFGILGEEPTHPNLLDWLAAWFVVEGRWSLKRLHRLIMTSQTYRMSNRWNPTYGEADPRNESLWRFPYRRLEIEAMRDSVLAVSGQLNRKMLGPGTYLSIPKEALEGNSDPHKIWKPLDEPEASRRTVYAFVKRSLVVPLLEVFDLCDTTRSTEIRNITSVAPQALTFFNGEFVNRQASHFANRLELEAGPNRTQQIELAYRLALCRRPTQHEIEVLQKFLSNEERVSSKQGKQQGESLSTSDVRHRALIQLCRVIFNLNEFVYHD